MKLLLGLSFVFYLLSALLYLRHLKSRLPQTRRGAFAIFTAAFILQSIVLGSRWWTAGYLPVTNLFATQFFFSWALAVTYFYFEYRYRIGGVGLFIILLNLLLLGSALPRDPSIPPLVPVLDTPLFTLHVSFSFFGYAFFALAFSLGALYLLQQRVRTDHLPDLSQLRKLNEEAIFLGFCFFTVCMVSGSLWAYLSWGYWFSWNIKGVWSFLIWLFYAGMCHAKFVRRWQGTGYAILSVAGFALVLFTYLGIGLLMSSNHPLD